MLNAHVVREGGYRYYVDDLVPGRAEGSPVAGEEPGAWIGPGAADLGVWGPVDPGPFAAVLDGRHPQSGELLRLRRGNRSVCAYDLTFGSPKSVSLLHLLAPREIATAVGESHTAAVADASEYLSRNAVGVRRTESARIRYLSSTGMVAGEFLHRTSRSLDPHLHTHVVAANVGQGVDGRWSGIDSRRLHAHLPAAQALYHARLRLELGERLGAVVRVGSSGTGDVLGVDPRLCHLFSQRRNGAVEYDFRRGRDLSRRSRGSFLATREGKDRSVTVEDLRAEWNRRARGFGFDLGAFVRVVGRNRTEPARAPFDVDRARRHLDGLAKGSRTLGPSDLVAAVAAASERGAPSQVVERVVGDLTRVLDRSPSGPSPRVGAPDTDLSGAPGGRRWSMTEVIDVIERRPSELAERLERAAELSPGCSRQPLASERGVVPEPGIRGVAFSDSRHGHGKRTESTFSFELAPPGR